MAILRLASLLICISNILLLLTIGSENMPILMNLILLFFLHSIEVDLLIKRWRVFLHLPSLEVTISLEW